MSDAGGEFFLVDLDIFLASLLSRNFLVFFWGARARRVDPGGFSALRPHFIYVNLNKKAETPHANLPPLSFFLGRLLLTPADERQTSPPHNQHHNHNQHNYGHGHAPLSGYMSRPGSSLGISGGGVNGGGNGNGINGNGGMRARRVTLEEKYKQEREREAELEGGFSLLF